MRAGIGLVGLLVCAGLIMYVFAETQIPVAKVGKQAQNEARQMSGRGDDGEAAENSFTVDADFGGSRLKALVVTGVTNGGAMQTYYGLLPGDRITAIDGTRIHEKSNNDDAMAKAQVAEAFGRRQTLTVDRGGQVLTLPVPAGAGVAGSVAPAPAPGSPGATGATGAAPATPPAPRSPLADQFRGIQDAAGGRALEEE